MVQCKYCDKQFWKLFTFFATVLVKLLCCSCNVFYSCLRAEIKYISAYVRILHKIEYVGLCYVSSSIV